MHDSDWEATAHIGRYKRNLMDSRLTLLFVNYDGSLVIAIPHRQKLRLGLFEWSSKGDTAVFDRRIVNTSVGVPLIDTACLDCV